MKKADFRSFLTWLREATTRRLWLKLFSLIIALLIWGYIISTNPSLTRSKFVSGLNLSVSGTASLKTYDLALATDAAAQYTGAISAQVDVSQSQYAKATNKNIVVTLDLSAIRTAGEHSVALKAVSSYGSVTKLYPETVLVTIENIDTRDVPTEAVLSGVTSDDYWYSVNTDSINPQQISVSGPGSIVQTVSGAIAQVDITGQTASFRRPVLLTLTDSADAPVPSKLLTKSSSTCSVSVDIYPKKELKVFVDASQINVEDGYMIESISFQPASISVAAPQELLDDLEMLPLEYTENVQPATQSFTTTLPVSQLSGFKYLSSTQTYMSVTIVEIEDTVALSNIEIQPKSLAAGYQAAITPEVFGVQVTGPRLQVNALKAKDVYAYVELEGLTEGVYELPIVIRNNQELLYDSLMPDVVKVEITKATS